MPESNLILSNIITRSENGISRLKIPNFNKHLSSLKLDTIDNGNISSENFNGSGIHLNRHGKGKLAMNLIKKSQELHTKNFNRNLQSLARSQCYVLDCVCNNDSKRKLLTAGPEHLLEIKHTGSSADSQDTGNRMNSFLDITTRNANQLIIGHLNIDSLRNKFEMLGDLIKAKIVMFLISETKLDSSFPSGKFVFKG